MGAGGCFMALPALDFTRTNLLNTLFLNYRQPAFALRTRDWEWTNDPSQTPAFCIAFQSQAALDALLHHPNEITLGEAFIHKEIEIEGDIYAALRLADYVFQHAQQHNLAALTQVDHVLTEAKEIFLHGIQHSLRRDRTAISYHYDKPPQFFLPWLGSTMVYSCAYFRDARQSIDEAQTNKLELVCRKLELKPEDHFLDIGCGWGSLILYAATQYGAHAYGITLSREQANFAENCIAQSPAGAHCAVALKDYRELPYEDKRYDKIASVGMVEHVGLKNLPTYFQNAFELLKPGGLFLSHGIGRAQYSPPPKDSFIQKYVFPDGELVPIHQTIACAEAAGFEVRDVENLREHYALTLRHWVKALQQNQSDVLNIVPEMTYRIWLLYMAGAAVAFDRGDIFVDQVLLRKVNRTTIAMPATREQWYQGWN
jgi:cyclopropane-fatty-acyl-phospholipid synthase